MASPTRRAWTHDELVLAMRLYCELPFGRLHQRNPEIVQLAKAMERTPSSVAMKLCNFASLDPALRERGVAGLSGASRGDRGVWAEFHADWSGLAVESERIRSAFGIPASNDNREETSLEPYEGQTEELRRISVRLAQRFFRRAVLASFDNRCCVSGISHPGLLIASHIAPWSQHPDHRANPRNGLCLSRMHDGAFDRGLITFDEEFRVVLSGELADQCTNEVLHACFRKFEGKTAESPHRFLPDKQLLAFHRQSVFRA